MAASAIPRADPLMSRLLDVVHLTSYIGNAALAERLQDLVPADGRAGSERHGDRLVLDALDVVDRTTALGAAIPP
jgi:hypothetical protein